MLIDDPRAGLSEVKLVPSKVKKVISGVPALGHVPAIQVLQNCARCMSGDLKKKA